MKWDYVTRNNNTKIVTIICHSKTSNKYLLISQPRVPVNKIVVEFPAGLIDPGESVETAGLRELKEETGYGAEVISVSPFVVKSAGLSDESTALVQALVEETAVGQTAMEPTEEITSFWVTPHEFLAWAKTLDPEKVIVDSHVWFYFQGIAAFLNKEAKKEAEETGIKKKSSAKKTSGKKSTKKSSKKTNKK